jgi:uncharacterized membrane protein YqjE
MTEERAGAAPRASLRSTIARLADSAIVLARTRAELATVELAEERLRWTRSVLLLAGGVLLLSFAMLGVAAGVVVYFWDTHRLAAISGVTLAFAFVGAILLWRNSLLWRNAPQPFAQTLAELDKDRASFRRASETEARE